ncbi:hypothetical protein ACOMHN_049532 [Nucella lapillus]
MKASHAGKAPVQAFELEEYPEGSGPRRQPATAEQREDGSKPAKDDHNGKSVTGIMATLLSTMSRRNRVGPESEAAEKAAKEFDSISTEAERYAVLKTIRQLSSPLAIKRQLM